MKDKKNFLIVSILCILLIGALGYFFFLRDEENSEDEKKVETEQETEMIRHSGRILEFGEDYFILEIGVFDPEADPFDENSEPKTISARVFIDEETEVLDSNDVKFVEIPEEYSEGLLPLEYISNLEEEYALSAVVDSYDAVVEDGNEVYAQAVHWSCYPVDGEW